MFMKRRANQNETTPQRIPLDRATFLVIDPADGQQQFEPEAGDFYVVESKGTQRAFLFEENKDDNVNCCDACCLAKEDSMFKTSMCPKFYCGVNNVTAREYVHNKIMDCFELKKNSDVESEWSCPAPIEINLDKPEPTKQSFCSNPKTPEERRAMWETALHDLEAEAQRADADAAEFKAQAKLAAKKAQALRSKIFDMLWQTSENFQPETPLFDAIRNDEENEEI